MSNKKIYKPQSISGYPEWLPEYRAIELQWLDHIRSVFESYGFCNIETPAAETLDAINAKGGDGGADVDKEVYVLERLHKEDGDKEARLALRFDQTVPLARYVAQHFNDLDFPFKRYQMQKVWRGERPQAGRSREFLQCDIDVINVDHLPLHFDAEMPAVIYEALSGLGIGKFQISISNRKILLGLLESLDAPDPVSITRIIDKMDKLPEDEIARLLGEECDLNDGQIEQIIALTSSPTEHSDARGSGSPLKAGMTNLSNIDPLNTQMAEGLEELGFVMDQLKHLPESAVKADLSIVRGLDYYTGTVFETRLLDIPEFTSSVCSGGRYDDLASSYINKHLPGVGISIGLTRLFEILKTHGYITPGAKSPSDVLVVLPSEDKRSLTNKVAETLRGRGFNVETYHAPQKIGKQIAYAEKKNIPYVWFPPFDDDGGHEVKNMKTGDQGGADPESWVKYE